MRIFIAIDLNETVRRKLEQLSRDMQDKTGLRKGPAKWVRAEQIHCTLKFLGDVPDDAVVDVCRAVESVAERHRSFELTVRGAGTFGRPARVLWAGTEPCPELNRLQEDLDNELEAAGWPKENRKFSAHLTLCRIKDFTAGRKLAEAIEPFADALFGTVFVEEVVVYESQLTSSGPIYTAAARYALQ